MFYSLKKKVHTFIRASVYGCTYKCIHIYIYTHTNTPIRLYAYVYVHVHLCVISKVGFFLENYYYYFRVKIIKIEMMVFSNFVPVIVKCVQFWSLFSALAVSNYKINRFWRKGNEQTWIWLFGDLEQIHRCSNSSWRFPRIAMYLYSS